MAAAKSLSEDLISEILVRLPVKLIVRCKTVSKSWESLISSPYFVNFHLRRPADQTLINCRSRVSIAFLNVNSGEIVANIDIPYISSEFYKVYLVGSTCGILCLCVSWYCEESYLHLPNVVDSLPITDTYLWNPVTKQSICIPPPTLHLNTKFRIVGFGFDHVSNDFKFLRIALSRFSAQVYSTNRKSWRNVEQVVHNSVRLRRCSGIFVCVKGYLCCMRYKYMIAFDLKKEVLNCAIELPVESINARVTEFNNSIAVVNWAPIDGKYNIKLWKLDNETSCISVGGVKASWSLMLSIDHWSKSCVYINFNNGDFLPSPDDDSWCFCKSDKNKKRELCYKDFYPVQVFKYVESLFSFT